MSFEKIDERPHKKCRNDCTYADHSTGCKGENHADNIATNSAKLKTRYFFIGQDQRNGIIGSDAEISSVIKSAAKALNYDGNQ